MSNACANKRVSLWIIRLIGLAAVVLFLGLGIWQTQRLAWKNDLIAKITSQAKAEPTSLDQLLDLAKQGKDIKFRRVRLSGSYRHGSELHFYTLLDGVPGWRVVTPFSTNNHGIVLVDRGFVPIPKKDQASRQADLENGAMEIIGAVRTEYAPKSGFTRTNIPAENRWYWMDKPELLKAASLMKILPFVVQLEAADHSGEFPKAVKVSPRLANNHLSYALTWFGMAIGLIIVFGVVLVKNWRTRPQQTPTV